MRKKQTQIAKVRRLLSENPNISAKEMAKELNLPVNRVYVLRSQEKKKTATTVKSITSKPSRAGTAKRYRENLEAENRKLTEWTQLWRQKYLKLEDDYTQAKIMYLDSQAVVKYLETKLATLLKGE